MFKLPIVGVWLPLGTDEKIGAIVGCDPAGSDAWNCGKRLPMPVKIAVLNAVHAVVDHC